MTNKKAIEILKSIRVYDIYPKSASEETKYALDLAIKALEERPQGEWIYDGEYHDENNPVIKDMYHCNLCKRSIMTVTNRPTDIFPYCHCGAKMKGEEE